MPGCTAALAAYQAYVVAHNAQAQLSQHDREAKAKAQQDFEAIKNKNTPKAAEERQRLQSLIDSYVPPPPLSAARWCCRPSGPLISGALDAGNHWIHEGNKMHSGSQTSGWQKWSTDFRFNNQNYDVEAHVHYLFPAPTAPAAAYNNGEGHYDNIQIKSGGATICGKQNIGSNIHARTGLDPVNQGNKNDNANMAGYGDAYDGMLSGGLDHSYFGM